MARTSNTNNEGYKCSRCKIHGFTSLRKGHTNIYSDKEFFNNISELKMRAFTKSSNFQIDVLLATILKDNNNDFLLFQICYFLVIYKENFPYFICNRVISADPFKRNRFPKHYYF
ncbi:hypothetical protein BLOT_004875 [Blomia tropicalis]|nr:hypothetical protein BLOT_004875 [Blomia tropicalis]